MTTWLNASRAVGGALINESIADQVVNAADTYLTGSAIRPNQGMKARTHFIWKGWITKTAAGVAAPIFKLRVGSGGVIGDTLRVTLTSPDLQTAVVDTGYFEIIAMMQAVGAAAVIEACLRLGHGLAATGFSVVPVSVVRAASAAFDLDALEANPVYYGLSVDPGAAGVWTFKEVIAEMKQT
jgi:hypothetical protein